MASARITREDLIEQAVSDFLKDKLFNERGYPRARVEFVDAFQEDSFTGPLDKNYVAIGFNFDDGGELIEMGSDLIQRTYTIEVWAVGTEPVAGRNLANTIRDIAEAENIPLRDYRQPGTPIIDYLQVDPVQVHRQPVQDPKPWQENLWIVHVPVVDCYYASES
jgi:hypothetical protein